jgi:hypothetical protein
MQCVRVRAKSRHVRDALFSWLGYALDIEQESTAEDAVKSTLHAGRSEVLVVTPSAGHAYNSFRTGSVLVVDRCAYDKKASQRASLDGRIGISIRSITQLSSYYMNIIKLTYRGGE